MMSESGEILALDSQEHKEKTLEEFLREEMESTDRISTTRRWVSLKERLIGFKRMSSCCGATWRFKAEQAEELQEEAGDRQIPASEEEGVDQAQGLNLAAALAAERQFRAAEEIRECGGGDVAATSAVRVSLMRLLEAEESGESDRLCCVCMGRRRGAALIPCGHTFCRVCSREVWVNRGSCPLCNRLINEILDIY